MSPEHALHMSVAQFLEAALPDDAVWFHYPAGGKRDKRTAALMKVMGQRPGLPDIWVLYRGKAVLIELKAGAGRLSSAQRDMHERLAFAGFPVATAFTLGAVEYTLKLHDIPLKARVAA